MEAMLGRGEGYARDAEYQRWLIWHGAQMQRAKRLPNLKTFVKAKSAKGGRKGPLSQAEIFEKLRRISGSPGPPGKKPKREEG